MTLHRSRFATTLVTDVTHVTTWPGIAYVAFVIGVFSRRIAGWNVTAALQLDIPPLQTLDMAVSIASAAFEGLVHHADHRSNFLAVV